VGPINNDIYKILLKISDKSLLETFKLLNNDDKKKLIHYYGEYWYKFIFLSQHINYTLKNNKKELLSILGPEWFEKHNNINLAITKRNNNE